MKVYIIVNQQIVEGVLIKARFMYSLISLPSPMGVPMQIWLPNMAQIGVA